MFKFSDPKANLHVFSEGCEDIDEMILFRDWLRNHADDRLLYEEKKRELAGRVWKYTQNYADAKSEVVQEILARARRNQIENPSMRTQKVKRCFHEAAN